MDCKYLVITRVMNKKACLILKTLDVFSVKEFTNIASAYKYWLLNQDTSYIAQKINGKVVVC
jgi:hypothetical protein